MTRNAKRLRALVIMLIAVASSNLAISLNKSGVAALPDMPRPKSGVAALPDMPRPRSGVAALPDMPRPRSGVAALPDMPRP